ncbi:MAG: rod shape-determining protein MreC [Gammaproteobacteria bacterium]
MKVTRDHRLFHATSRGRTLRTGVLIVAAVALMALDHHYQPLSYMRTTLLAVVYPVQWLVNSPGELGRALGSDLATRHTLLTRNAELERKLMHARVDVARMDALKDENRRLRLLLNAVGHMPGRVVATSILRVDMSPFQSLITVNAGKDFGVHPGQPVIDADGVVGQITGIGPLQSQIMLITDPASAIPVEIERTGLATLAIGTGQINVLSLPYLPNSTDIKPGDRLIASGFGGRYPRGYPVAIVTAVTPQAGEPFAQVSARPLAHLGREHEVLLYFTAKPDQASTK